MDDITIDYPMNIRSGSKKYEEREHTPFNWTNGFGGDKMWLLYLHTGKNIKTELLDVVNVCRML